MKQPIGIVDSGVGGLGILRELSKLLPNENLIYLADNNNLPLGEKTEDQIRQISSKIFNFLISKHNIKMGVVACNTLSVSALDHLRKNFSIPIVGTVPVVKPSCELTQAKKIAILATRVTANSQYQRDLISKYCNGVQALSIGCPGLVEFIEEGCLDSPELAAKLKDYLTPAIDINVDIIGLACTHYPFIRDQIAKLVSPKTQILDSNEAVAKQVAKLIHQEALCSNNDAGSCSFFVTKHAEKFESVGKMLIGNIVSGVSLIVL
jgi:glutamate racemase